MLFLIIFLWTPPHFWALALYKQSDYGAAGIPMLPNVAGEPATKLQILRLLGAPRRARPWCRAVIGFAGSIYTAVALLTGARFICLRLARCSAPARTSR